MLAGGEREEPGWVASCSGRGCAEEASGWTSGVKMEVNTEASMEELVLGSDDRVIAAFLEKNSWGV